jgi:IS5 family transposase
MDRDIWASIVRLVRRAERELPRPRRRAEYPDGLIVLMCLWAVWHDRPMCWACQRCHYGTLFRPRRLPSVSRFSRRLRSPRCAAILQRLHDLLSAGAGGGRLSFLDGKPLPVGESTKDPDARTGRGAGRFSRGYRLHAWGTADGRIPVWAVTAMNVQEQTVAPALLEGRNVRGLLLADGNYDGAPLYERVDRAGGVLLTPLRRTARKRKYLRAMPRSRLAVLAAWAHEPERIWRVYRRRGQIERTFANATSFGGGLAPLPAWVRRLDRVRRWVGVKLIIYHARLRIRRAAVA